VDSAICGYGGVLLYRPGSRPETVRLEGPRNLIVVFSGLKRNTGRLVSHVAEVSEKLPDYFSGLVKSLNDLSLTAAGRLESGDMDGVGALLTLNHAVLAEVGVSTPELDGLVDTLISLGCHGAKLTGAGGGGSVLAVAPHRKEKRIISEARRQGYEAFVSTIPVEGVKSWRAR
jgi:mevalonate kinase